MGSLFQQLTDEPSFALQFSFSFNSLVHDLVLRNILQSLDEDHTENYDSLKDQISLVKLARSSSSTHSIVNHGVSNDISFTSGAVDEFLENFFVNLENGIAVLEDPKSFFDLTAVMLDNIKRLQKRSPLVQIGDVFEEEKRERIAYDILVVKNIVLASPVEHLMSLKVFRGFDGFNYKRSM